MTMPDTSPGIDLMDLSVFTDGQEMPVFDDLREHDPVHWNAPSPRGPGFWALTRYRDVRDAASDHRRLSSASGTQIMDRKVEGNNASLHNMDDPEHAQLRKVAIPHLRAVKLKRWQESIDEAVSGLLDQAEEHGTFDLVDLISARLPMLVLSRVMGVPAGEAPRMVDWTNRLTSSDPDQTVDQTALAEARDELMSSFAALTEQRRAEPTDDLFSILVNAEVEGQRMSDDEIVMETLLILIGGDETTRHTLSGGVDQLLRHRDQWDRLRENATLLPGAIEEMLRWNSPVVHMARTATADVEIRGQRVAKGEAVVMLYGSANRDEDVFGIDSEEFKVTRHPNPHIAFGCGEHSCIGAQLARLEATVMFEELLGRFPRLELVGEVDRMRATMVPGVKRMPVRLGA